MTVAPAHERTSAAGPFRPERTTPRALVELATAFSIPIRGEAADVLVSGASVASRDVRPGDLFAAVPGARAHGARFAGSARDAGAAAVLTDEAGACAARATGLPVLVAPDPRALLGPVAGWIHRTAEDPPLLLGVTGTNGKTTTVAILDAVLTALGRSTGTSTTIERRIGAESRPSHLTSPEASELHAMLATMRERGADAAAIEVSAQAVQRQRIGGVRFDVAGFTNLTHDHLDEFGDMAGYFAAKAALFEPPHARRGVVSLDSPWGRRLAATAGVPVVTLGGPDRHADWTVEVCGGDRASTAFRLAGPAGALTTSVGLPGAHAAADAALALVMLVEAGYGLGSIGAALGPAGIRVRLPGRLEPLPSAGGPAVYIDIGHTPDAFAKSLTALRATTPGRLLMVFGADGDRDPTKRPAMGRTAAELADVVVVSDHHARFEDPDRIRAALLAGAASAAHPAEVHEVRAPEDAIRCALALAGPGDTVLWAGTGRTGYRDLRGVKTPYSFREEALRAIAERGWSAAQDVVGVAAAV